MGIHGWRRKIFRNDFSAETTLDATPDRSDHIVVSGVRDGSGVGVVGRSQTRRECGAIRTSCLATVNAVGIGSGWIRIHPIEGNVSSVTTQSDINRCILHPFRHQSVTLGLELTLCHGAAIDLQFTEQTVHTLAAVFATSDIHVLHAGEIVRSNVTSGTSIPRL